VHAVGADQHPHAGRRPRGRHRTVLLFILGLRLQRRQADRRQCHRAQGRGCLPCHVREDFGIATRVARYHNVYGPEGTYDGGREKAPAAICRKVIAAKLSGKHEIEIWGDGEQTRSFMYIDDCTQGTIKLAQSDIIEPLNIGSDELVSINRLVDIVEKIAGVKLKRSYKLDAPKGVRGRNSDNTRLREVLGWEPEISLEEGLAKTYSWISTQLRPRHVRTERREAISA